MKLQQLKEARYAGDHPVLAQIEKTLGMPQGSTTFWDIEERDVASIQKSITAKYGEPTRRRAAPPRTATGSGHVYKWRAKNMSGKRFIAIGYDPDMIPPYGVEVF